MQLLLSLLMIKIQKYWKSLIRLLFYNRKEVMIMIMEDFNILELEFEEIREEDTTNWYFI
ncbi:hypothetical protein PC0014_11070 [Streptococcus pneumoniae]|nr:hypothetical protein PC0014_11070 [Streptococcus pneumoniae]BEL31083.1 hypothetical protein TKY121806_09820 [Streptococcus pneumoniae]